MAKEAWHRRYKDRLIQCGGLTEDQAEASLQAGMGEYDYEVDPKDAADDDMSYWPGEAI